MFVSNNSIIKSIMIPWNMDWSMKIEWSLKIRPNALYDDHTQDALHNSFSRSKHYRGQSLINTFPVT